MSQHSQLPRSNPGELCQCSVFPRGKSVEVPTAHGIERHVSPIAADFRQLLVPLDGSPSAEHALPHALDIARRSGGTVCLMHVHSTAELLNDPWAHFYGRDVYTGQYEKMQGYLHDLVQRVRRVETVNVVAEVSSSNNVIDALCQAAAECDLVVMATRGRGFWKRLWHASVTDALVHRLNCPLLIVRGHDLPVDLGRHARQRWQVESPGDNAGRGVSLPRPNYG